MSHITRNTGKLKNLGDIAEAYQVALSRLQALPGKDIEMEHEAADAALCDLLEVLGCTEVVRVFCALPKMYA